MKNYYQILGIGKFSDAQQIKNAYRKLAMRYHPDKNPGADSGAMIVRINEAYSILGDPVKKKKYDMELMYFETRPVRKPPPTVRKKHRPAYNTKQEKEYSLGFNLLEYFLFAALLIIGISGLYMAINDWVMYGFEPSHTISGLVFGILFTGLLGYTMWLIIKRRKP